ncbi:MAG: hypothetical protein IJR99_12170 [Kiritimatiellae bacterium]|nr:hypothetical protein [Kiritimatiellia bacterium]
MFHVQNYILIALAIFAFSRILRCSLLQSVCIALFFGALAGVATRIAEKRTEFSFWQDMDSLLAQPYDRLTKNLADRVRRSNSDIDLVRIFEDVHANAFLIQCAWKGCANHDTPSGNSAYEHFAQNLIRRRPVQGSIRVKLHEDSASESIE